MRSYTFTHSEFSRICVQLGLTVGLLLSTGESKGSLSTLSATRWRQRLQIPQRSPEIKNANVDPTII